MIAICEMCGQEKDCTARQYGQRAVCNCDDCHKKHRAEVSESLKKVIKALCGRQEEEK